MISPKVLLSALIVFTASLLGTSNAQNVTSEAPSAAPPTEPPDLIGALETYIRELLESQSDIPAVSVALIQDSEIRWAAAFGVTVLGDNSGSGDDQQRSRDEVDERTLFQAASISKPVAAAAMMRLVDQGVLSLDESVNDQLTSWKLPGEGAETVTLRQLLSHRAGLNVHGFPGYLPSEEIPSAPDILNGKGNTDAVRITETPGSEFRYSGGGYVIAQQLVVDVVGETFPEILKKQVLDPIGMVDSTYEQPLPEALWTNASRAHLKGRPYPNPWFVYPELAAAGLWTTPTDLARFLLAIRESLDKEEGAFLSMASAREMTTPRPAGNPVAVGLFVDVIEGEVDNEGDLIIGHSGANQGYICKSGLSLNGGYGFVVMTNSMNGRMLSKLSTVAFNASRGILPGSFDASSSSKSKTDGAAACLLNTVWLWLLLHCILW